MASMCMYDGKQTQKSAQELQVFLANHMERWLGERERSSAEDVESIKIKIQQVAGFTEGHQYDNLVVRNAEAMTEAFKKYTKKSSDSIHDKITQLIEERQRLACNLKSIRTKLQKMCEKNEAITLEAISLRAQNQTVFMELVASLPSLKEFLQPF